MPRRYRSVYYSRRGKKMRRRRYTHVTFEKKFIDLSARNQNPQGEATGLGGCVITPICQVAQGNGEDQRNGNHIALDNLHYKFWLRSQDPDTGDDHVLFKIMIVVDKHQQLGISPTENQLLAYRSGTDLDVMSWNNKKSYANRFRTLFSKYLVMSNPALPSSSRSSNSRFIHGSVNLGGIQQFYSDTASTDIAKNGIYLVFVDYGVSTANVAEWKFDYNFRMNFVDK